MKKLILMWICIYYSSVQSTPPEWEWVRVIKNTISILYRPEAILIFHASRQALQENPLYIEQHYGLTNQEIEQLLQKKCPTRFIQYEIEWGSGTSSVSDTDSSVVRILYE